MSDFCPAVPGLIDCPGDHYVAVEDHNGIDHLYLLPIPPERGEENPFCFCTLSPGVKCAGYFDDQGVWQCPSIIKECVL